MSQWATVTAHADIAYVYVYVHNCDHFCSRVTSVVHSSLERLSSTEHLLTPSSQSKTNIYTSMVDVPILEYDKDQEENFLGPSFLQEEEYDGDEYYDEGDAYDEYDNELSAAQPSSGSNAGLVSQHTQLGAAPGTADAVPGNRELEPETAPQPSTATFEFASSGSATPLQSGAQFHPDGSPVEDVEELEMMNELQRVQREISG